MGAERGPDQASARSAPRGMLHALRSIGPSIIALLRTRLELFGIELAEEKERAAHLAVLGALALLFAGLALLMVNLLVLTFFWNSHRFAAIGALIFVYGALAFLCVARLQAAVAARPPMFEATLTELKADVEALSRVRQE